MKTAINGLLRRGVLGGVGVDTRALTVTGAIGGRCFPSMSSGGGGSGLHPGLPLPGRGGVPGIQVDLETRFAVQGLGGKVTFRNTLTH